MLYGDNVLRAYVLSVIGIVIFSAILSCIIPDGKTASMIRGVTKTACVAIIVAPILSFFQSGKIPGFMYGNFQEIFTQSGIQTDGAFIEYYSEMRVEEVQGLLETELHEKFGIKTEVFLKWTRVQNDEDKLQKEGILIQSIKVQGMEKQDDKIKNEVKEYLSKNYCSEVQIE